MSTLQRLMLAFAVVVAVGAAQSLMTLSSLKHLGEKSPSSRPSPLPASTMRARPGRLIATCRPILRISSN
ncbi:MAG: hypothetical protein H3C55_12380 [Pseudorhodoplanes sp.]|nr:hypothetical protein [Pseudorhodoplanes sp.]